MNKVSSCWLFYRLRPIVIFAVIILLLSNSSLLAQAEYHPKNPCVMVLSYQVYELMYEVDGEQKGPMDVAPEIKDSRMFLVIRYVTSEIPGTTMMWDSYSRRVTIILPTETVLKLWIGNPKALVEYADGTINEVWIDNENHDLAPYIKDPGYTMLPMRFVADYLGATAIEWDGSTKTVDLEFVDYECLDNRKTVSGRIETVTNQEDGTVKVVFVDASGESRELTARDDLTGDGVELTLSEYQGYAELVLNGDWISGWSPIPDHQPFGVLKSIEFEQLELIVDNQVFKDSNWGRVKLTHLGYEDVLYFNCVLDGRWVIKNRVVMNHVEVGEEQLLNFTVDLGNESGTDVDEVVYSASLLGDVSVQPPDLKITSAVTEGRMCVSGGLGGYVPFNTLSVNDEDNKPPKPPPQQGAGKAEKTSTHKDFPNQQCKPQECVPTAVSNSLKFLNKKNKLKLTDEQTGIGKMKKATGWVSSTFGAPVQTWWSKKKAYMEKHRYPITTRRFYNFDLVIAELAKGQDVEMCVWAISRHTRKPCGGHAVSVTGIAKCEEGYDIDFVHDSDQSDPKEGTDGTWSATYHTQYRCFTGGGVLVCNAEYYYFVVECPKTVVPEGSSTPVPATPPDGKTTGGKGGKVVTTPSPSSSDDKKGDEGDSEKKDNKNIRLNQIKVFPLEEGQYPADAIMGEPIYTSSPSPMNNITIPEGILETGKQYCWHAEAEMTDGYPCGVSHPTTFTVTDDELEWVNGYLSDVYTDGNVIFEPFEKQEDERRYTVSGDIVSVVNDQSMKDYQGFAKLLTDTEGSVHDWFPLDYLNDQRDMWQVSIVQVDGIYESDAGSFFWGITSDGVRQTFKLPLDMEYHVISGKDYIVSGHRHWWECEIDVEKIKPAPLPDATPEWVNCEITSYQDGILYVRLAGDETAYDFFALPKSEDGIEINKYTGCAEIQVIQDTVIDWKPRLDQSICGLASYLDFYQLDIKSDTGIQKNTNWCMAEFTSTGYRKPLYLNVSIGQRFVVENMWLPIMETGPFRITLDLGTQSGDNVASVLYGHTLTESPILNKPKANSKADLADLEVSIKPSWTHGTQPRNPATLGEPAETIKCSKIEESYKLRDMSLPDYRGCESIPATLCSALKSVAPDGSNANLISEGLTKKSSGWVEDKGCRYSDGDLYDELSWWKSSQNYFVKNNRPFDLFKLDTAEQILSHAKEGYPILLDVCRDGYHHLAGVNSVTHLESGGMMCRIIHDINQDNMDSGIISEVIHLNEELTEITGGLWLNGSEEFEVVGVKARTDERPKITLVSPTHASNVVNPYPFFEWSCSETEADTTYSLFIYKVKMGHPISASVKGKDPVFSIHGLTDNTLKYPSNKLPLDKDTLYAWFVTADNPNRTIRSMSRISTFTFSPAECIDIRGQILSARRNPNSGIIEILFKQCAVAEPMTILSSENMFDTRRVSVLVGYSGCADVCVIDTDDGLFLDSWTVVDGDCCIDEPCVTKKGRIIEAFPRSGEYAVYVRFKPCGEAVTELVSKSNLPDMLHDIPLIGYAGCAEVCVTSGGVISSWSALPEDEDCCDEPCCDLNVTWRTNDGEPPVVLTCPGSSHLLRSILRLENDCINEEISFDYTLSSSWQGVLVDEIETISPRTSTTKTIEFTTPADLPATLTVDVTVCDERERFTIQLHEMPNCEECCDFEVDWSDRIIDEYGDPPEFKVCEEETIELEFVTENLCDDSLSGTIYLQSMGSGIDYITESRTPFELMKNGKATTTLSLAIDDDNIKSESWRLFFASECGESRSLEFTIDKRRDCFEKIFATVSISEKDCDKKVVYAFDMERMKEWTLEVSYEDCQHLEIGSCWVIMGEKISDEIIRVIEFQPIDCP